MKVRKFACFCEEFTGTLAEPIELPPPSLFESTKEAADRHATILTSERLKKLNALARHYGHAKLDASVLLPLVLQMASDFVPGFRHFTAPEAVNSVLPPAMRKKPHRSRYEQEAQVAIVDLVKRLGLAESDAKACRVLAAIDIEATNKTKKVAVSEIKRRTRKMQNIIASQRSSSKRSRH